MLTTTFLTLAIPAMVPQTWPASLLPPVVVDDQTVTLIKTGDEFKDRRDFARKTAGNLISYYTLGHDNWDGEGAIAVRESAVDEALAMLEVTPLEIGAPRAMVLATGDVSLYWETEDTYAEIGFDGSGTYYAHASRPGMESVYLDDVPTTDAAGRTLFPPLVRNLLNAAVLQQIA